MTLTDAPAATNGTTPVDAGKAATDAGITARIERAKRVAKLRANGWKLTLSGGQWAVLVDPETVSERKIRAIKIASARATPNAPTGASATIGLDAEAAIDSSYVMVAAFVAEWSYGTLPNTANIEPLLELPARDYSALEKVCEDLKDEAITDYSADPEPSSPFVPPSG